MKNTENIDNKVVVITGGAGGFGRALAKEFAALDAKLAVVDFDTAALKEFQNEPLFRNRDDLFLQCDVSSEKQCARTIAAVTKKFGHIDVLINNAGLSMRGAFSGTSLEAMHRIMDVNFWGSVHMTRHALPHIKSARGSIIVLSSVAGFAPLIARTMYSASKHALHGFFESLRTELYEDNVHVMMVCPSFASTGIGKNAIDGSGVKMKKEKVEIGRALSPDIVAGAVLKGLINKKDIIYVGSLAKRAALVYKFFPGLYSRIMAKRLKTEMES